MSNATDQWFYRLFGEQFGPMPLEQLQQLAADGTIRALDDVRSISSVDWVAAATIDELGLSTSERKTVPTMATMNATDSAIPTPQQGRDDWYCRMGEIELGPMTFDELIGFAEQQQITADDQVKLGADGKWRKAASIGRLMAAFPYQVIEKTIVCDAKPKMAIESNPTVATSGAVSPAGRAAPRSPAAPARKSVPAVARKTTGKGAVLDRSEPIAASSAGPGSDPAVSAPKIIPAPVPPVAPNTLPPQPLVEPALANLPRASVAAQIAPPISSTRGSSFASGSGNMSMGMSRPATIPPRPVPRTRARSDSTWFADTLENLKDPKALGSAALIAVVLLIVGWGYLPKSHSDDIKRYHALKQLVNEIKSKRTSAPAELTSLQDRLTKTAKEIAAEVKDKAGRDDPAKQGLLWAARDEVPRLVAAGLAVETPSQKSLETLLQGVAYDLGLEKRPVITLAQNAASD